MTIHLGRFRYTYEGGVAYEIQCDTDTQLHWRCVAGDEAGREATETVDRVQLREGQHLLSWTESDGLTVSQVVDFTAGRVDAVLTLPDHQRIVLRGALQRL